MYVHIIAPPLQNNTGVLPAAYFNFKTYYEHVGEYPDLYEWPLPPMYDFSIESMMDHFEKYPPTVLGLGVYIWNVDFCYELAEKVRERYPVCVIIGGGPQPAYKHDQNYFKKHPYIDVVVPYDGEMPLTDILDQLGAGYELDYSECANVVYPTPFGWQHSIKQIPATDFEWPDAPMAAQEEIAKKYVDYFNGLGIRVDAFIDTARGCPYACTFCDWGGSAQTKIRKKPMRMVIKEAECMARLKIDFVHFTDANFGILKRDVWIATIYAEIKKETGYPDTLYMLYSKINKERTGKICKIMTEAGLTPMYHAAVQDLNPEIQANVNRKELSFQEHLEIFNQFEGQIEDYQFELGTILSLPGQTFDTLLNDVDKIISHNVMYPAYHDWMMLPNSPAAEPEYIAKWGIKTIHIPPVSWPVAAKPEFADSDFGKATVITRAAGYGSEVVIETSSMIDSREYVKMRSFTGFMSAVHGTGLLRYIAFGLASRYGIKYSDFYRGVYEECLDEFASDIEHQLYQVVNGQHKYLEFEPYAFPKEFPFLMPVMVWWRAELMWFTKTVYTALIWWLQERGWYDDDIMDLVKFNRMLMITPDYDPREGRTWQSHKDWLAWIQQIPNNSISTVLPPLPEKQYTKYVTDQNTVTFTNHTMPIEWHMKEKRDDVLLDYFYKTCYGTKAEIIFTDIRRT